MVRRFGVTPAARSVIWEQQRRKRRQPQILAALSSVVRAPSKFNQQILSQLLGSVSRSSRRLWELPHERNLAGRDVRGRIVGIRISILIAPLLVISEGSEGTTDSPGDIATFDRRVGI